MGNWNYEDFLQRLEAIKEMGSLEEIVEQVPALAAILEHVDFDLDELDSIERILRAMTLEERLNPNMLEGDEGLSRRQRVADSSETTLDAVNDLIWQFKTLRQMLKRMSPEQVTQEMLQSMQPNLESWQTHPDAWKQDEMGAFVISVEHEQELDDEPVSDPTDGDPLEVLLDDILRKISRTGMGSLTSQERAFLEEASRRLREGRAS